MAGVYTMSDKHIAVSKADLDGLARPGQIIVDADDYSLWVGNADGELVSAGGDGGGSASIGDPGTVPFVGLGGSLEGNSNFVYERDGQELILGPSEPDANGNDQLQGRLSTGSVSADGYVASKTMVSGKYIEAGQFLDGSTITVNLEEGCYFGFEVVGPVTIDVVRYMTEGPFASRFTFQILNGGSDTITWPIGFKWPGGVEPTLSPSGIDIIEFITTDGGYTAIGIVKALNVPV